MAFVYSHGTDVTIVAPMRKRCAPLPAPKQPQESLTRALIELNRALTDVIIAAPMRKRSTPCNSEGIEHQHL